MKNRYVVRWSHCGCNEQTCDHEADYRIYDTVEKRFVLYDDDPDHLQNICKDWNREEEFNEQI
jgi:hypothetical protein